LLSLLGPILKIAVAATVAAAVAYAGNRLARAVAGRAAVVFVAPGLEETLKTGAALALGAPVLAAHLAFGGLEAAYDLMAGARGGRAGPGSSSASAVATGHRLGAALAGLLGHTLFGALTVVVAGATGGFWPAGVGAAYLVHVGWNALVMGKVAAAP
jgi:hypothetical protein